MQTSCAPKKRLMTFITLRLNYMLRESLIIPYFVNPSSWLTFFIFLVNKILTAVCSLLRTEGSVTQSKTYQLCLNLTLITTYCCNYKNPYQGCRERAEWVLPTEWQFSTIIFLWLNTLQKILYVCTFGTLKMKSTNWSRSLLYYKYKLIRVWIKKFKML